MQFIMQNKVPKRIKIMLKPTEHDIARVIFLMHDTLPECALLMYEASLKYR